MDSAICLSVLIVATVLAVAGCSRRATAGSDRPTRVPAPGQPARVVTVARAAEQVMEDEIERPPHKERCKKRHFVEIIDDDIVPFVPES